MVITRKTVVVGIAVFVGLLHFVVGPGYDGPFPYFVHGYLIDILLPMAMYLVAGLVRHPFVGSSLVRLLAIFGVGATVETLQYFEIPVLGRTFDPVDYLMYAIGVGLGLILENGLLSRMPAKDEIQAQ